jgi:hypothetical protein
MVGPLLNCLLVHSSEVLHDRDSCFTSLRCRLAKHAKIQCNHDGFPTPAAVCGYALLQEIFVYLYQQLDPSNYDSWAAISGLE